MRYYNCFYIIIIAENFGISYGLVEWKSAITFKSSLSFIKNYYRIHFKMASLINPSSASWIREEFRNTDFPLILTRI